MREDAPSSPAAVTVALDWTPNGNHAGFYLAKDLGLYQAAGLDVRLVSPHDRAYAGSYHPGASSSSDAAAAASAPLGSSPPPYVTPCSKLAAGEAQFAINSPEGVVGWNLPHPTRPALKAVAALLADRDTSAIVTLASSGLSRPRDLDGKRYASYAARFEGRIVQRVIQADGGSGAFVEETPPMLGIWNALVDGEYDATWVFLQWEGVEAKMRGLELNAFKLGDFGVPYAYAPCLCADPRWLERNEDVARRFLRATAEGYEAASRDPRRAADALVRLARLENDGFEVDPELARASVAFLAEKFVDPAPGARWGRMEDRVWREYVEWLHASGLLTTGTQSRHPDGGRSFSLDDLRERRAGERIPLEDVPRVYTNEYLPE